jgi:hypothetical protein
VAGGEKVSFALKAHFNSFSVAYGGGEITVGKGGIQTDDPALIAVLDASEGIKRGTSSTTSEE